MLKTIATQLTACFISMALLTPSFVCATGLPARKSQEEIKKLLSAQNPQGRAIKNSDLVTLSLLSAAVAGAGGLCAGALWQKAKTNSAKNALIKELEHKVSFLNNALKSEASEQNRLLRVLDEQANLFAKVIRPGQNAASQDLARAELKGFNRGHDVAFRGSEQLSEVYYQRGFRAGYGQKAAEEVMAGKAVKVSKGAKVANVKAEAMIKSLREEIIRLQGDLGVLKHLTGQDREILSLMAKANKNISVLTSAPRSSQTTSLEQEITATINALKKVPVNGAKKEFVDSFSNAILCRLKTRGGLLVGIGVAALFSAGIIAVSGDKPAPSISYARLNIQRSVKDIYETRPELFATQILVLKDQYGAELVSSVLYENQEYLPLLQAQLSVISSAEFIAMLEHFKGRTSPAQNKQMLLNSLSAG